MKRIIALTVGMALAGTSAYGLDLLGRGERNVMPLAEVFHAWLLIVPNPLLDNEHLILNSFKSLQACREHAVFGGMAKDGFCVPAYNVVEEETK